MKTCEKCGDRFRDEGPPALIDLCADCWDEMNREEGEDRALRHADYLERHPEEARE